MLGVKNVVLWQLVFYCLVLIANSKDVRKVLSVHDLCIHNFMQPSLRLSTSRDRDHPTAVGLMLDNIRPRMSAFRPWARHTFDCTVTIQAQTIDTALGITLNNIDLAAGSSVECLDYLEINDGNNAIRLCGDVATTDHSNPIAVPTSFDSERGFLTIHIFSRPSLAKLKFPFQSDPSFLSLQFYFNVFAYNKVSGSSECSSLKGFYCGYGGRCLPQSLVCDSHSDCDGTHFGNDEKENCSTTDKNMLLDPLTLSPVAIAVMVVCIVLCLVSLVTLFFWSKRHFLLKDRHRTSSNQDLTESTSSDPDPTVFVVDSCHHLSQDAATAPPYETLYPSGLMTLSPQSSLGLMAANEAPPPYDILFGDKISDNERPKLQQQSQEQQ